MIDVGVPWAVNRDHPTCRHVLDTDHTTICRQTRGWFITVPEERRAELMTLPICGRCRPIAWARGINLKEETGG